MLERKEDQDYKVKVCRARTREFLMTCEDDSKDFSWVGKLAKSCVDRAIEQQKKDRQMIEEQKPRRKRPPYLMTSSNSLNNKDRDVDHHGRSSHSVSRSSLKHHGS